MIPRYTKPEMAAIWSDENRLSIMLEVEILAAEAMAKAGIVPAEAVARIRKKAHIDVPRILEIENTVKHDVIAFLTQVGETVGPAARYLHLGMTSSDVLDTALGVQLLQSCDLLLEAMEPLLGSIKALAERYKDTPMIGRTHGIHAEPITFGLKAASWYAEISRAKKHLEEVREFVRFGKISGAVGTYAHLTPKIEEYVCKKLRLYPEPVSTQVIPRDRHADYVVRCALVASSIERISVELRHMQRTEVGETEEPFSKGQKGSSAMPHKRNPILSENLCGLARLLRGYAVTSMENVALWHERDISHSSAERVLLPDVSIALHFMLVRLNQVLAGLQVYPQNMLANLSRSQDVIYSGTLLLALVNKGLTREDAYALMQKAAFAARDQKKQLKDVVEKDPDIAKHLSFFEIEQCFDVKSHFKNVDFILKRCFEEYQ